MWIPKGEALKMSDLEASVKEEPHPPYIIFVVVFLFFLTGLCGFLICHLLKKKGYSCHVEDDEEEEEKLGMNEEDDDDDDDDDDHQDTVDQILKCIIENEANMDAFDEMLGSHNICVQHDPRLRKASIGGLPPHLHTVHSGTDHDVCRLCAQIRPKKGRRPSRTHRFKQRPGEQTVFSVGRFRVTHTDKKQLDSRVPDILVASEDLLDQSQDSEDRKDGGYNLRNMFKDVCPPSESSNGMAPPNVGKRKKNLFGLRRGSDPIGLRVISAGTDGIKFIPQPVVLEELGENGDNGTKPDSKQESLGNKTITASKNPAKSSSNANTQAPIAVEVEHSKQQTNMESKTVLLNFSPKPLSQTEQYKTQVQFVEEPVQTSISLPDSGEGISPFRPESGPQTPPDLHTGPVQEQSDLASPGLSLHSSTGTSTSPLAVTPSPESSVEGMQNSAFSKVSLNEQKSSELPFPSRSLDKDITCSVQSQTPSPSLLEEAMSSKPTDQESSSAQISSPETKTESVSNYNQTAPKDSEAQQSMDKPEQRNLELKSDHFKGSPFTPLGGSISVTIVKGNPNSKMEFSVVTIAKETSDKSPAK